MEALDDMAGTPRDKGCWAGGMSPALMEHLFEVWNLCFALSGLE